MAAFASGDQSAKAGEAREVYEAPKNAREITISGLAAVRLLALGEEAMLMQGLAGYRDYASKVRFRLLPGVW